MPDPVDWLSLLSEADNRQKLRTLGGRILEDASLRRQFIDDPRTVLEALGLPVQPTIELSPRDRALLELIGDNRVVTLFEAGQFSELDRYIRDRYQPLVSTAAEGEGRVNVDTEVLAVVLVVVAAVVVTEVVVVGEVPPPDNASR